MNWKNCTNIGIVGLLLSLLFSPGMVAAKQEWKLKRLDPRHFPQAIVTDNRALAKNGLPDGRIATSQADATIKRAWYSQPTKRYGHGVLGDAIEAGALVAITANGRKVSYRLPETEVFEDITPRLADLDGDGTTEVITIISSLRLGASLGIFQIEADSLVRKAQSPYIGRANRWLNIAGIASYKGDGHRQIAIVVTPHIGGRLDLFEFDGQRLKRAASSQGFSNHIIGSSEQRLSASYPADGNNNAGMNLALPSANRRTLKIMAVTAKGWTPLGAVELPSPIDKAIQVKGRGDRVVFTLGLSDGTVYSVSQ